MPVGAGEGGGESFTIVGSKISEESSSEFEDLGGGEIVREVAELESGWGGACEVELIEGSVQKRTPMRTRRAAPTDHQTRVAVGSRGRGDDLFSE